MNVKLLIIILDREGLILHARLDRARVNLPKINVDKEKEKLRKIIQAGTSTVFKFRL
jgi:hypothetical protein